MMTPREKERIYKKATRNYNKEQRRQRVSEKRLIRKELAESNEALQTFFKGTGFFGYLFLTIFVLFWIAHWLNLGWGQ